MTLGAPLLPGGGSAETATVVFSSRPANDLYRGYGSVFIVPPLMVLYRFLWWRNLTPLQQQLYQEYCLVYDLAYILLCVLLVLFRLPRRIQIHSNGSLRIDFVGRSASFGPIESVQRKPQLWWWDPAGSLRRIRTDYATSIRNRVVVKMAKGGTEVVVAPDDVDGFVEAVEWIVATNAGSLEEP